MEAVAKKPVVKAVPTLRFKAYDKPWIRTRLSKLCSSINVGFVGTCEPYYTTPDNGVLLIRTGNVKDGRFDFSDVKYVTRDFHERNRKSQVLPGDLLVARHGSNGQATLVGDDLPESHCLNIVMIRTGPELGQMFLQEQLNSEALQKQIKGLTAGSTQGVINTGALASLEVTAPTLPEQQKIAAFLGAVDRKIQHLKRKQELLEQYKKGVVQQLFSQKLRFKRKDGGEFPEWEEKRLGDVGETYNGLTGKAGADFGEGMPFITYKQIFASSKIDLASCEFVSIEPGENQTRAQKGDAFFTTSSETREEVGFASVLLDDVNEVYLNSFSFGYRIHSHKVLSPDFARFLFRSEGFREDMIKLGQGSTRYNISKTGFREINVQLPSLEEQSRIAGFLMALDAKVAGVAQAVAAAQKWKKGLLQQMFV